MATNHAPGAFWTTPVDEAAGRLAGLIERHRPDVVVTYDENGFYGHPDHAQAHRVTMAALALTGTTAKAYWTTMPHSAMAEFARIAREQGLDLASELPEDGPQLGLPDDQVTTWVDVSAHAQQKFDALAAHGSQEENILFLRMPMPDFTTVMGTETFLRVHDTTGAALPEDDLFAGLR